MGDQDSLYLLNEANSGDEASLNSLLARHLPSLEAYVRVKAGEVVKGREQTLDMLQSVCCEVIKNPGEFEYRGEAAFRNWLFKRALQKIMNKARYHGQEKRDVGLEVHIDSGSGTDRSWVQHRATPSRIAMGREDLERLEAAFEQINEDYKEAVLLYRVVGMSYPEIAAEMGRSEGAVRNLVYRGLAQLSGVLDED